MVTRFMQVMFSASENNDEELTKQVADDIDTASSEEPGEVLEDEEVSYVNLGSGKVLIVDKGNGEATIAEQSEEDPEQYELEGFENEEELEKYLHPLDDGVTPDENVTTGVTENFEDHMTGEDVISPNLEDGGLNPLAGHEPDVLEYYDEDEDEEDDEDCDDEECEDEEKTYSMTLTEEELVMFSDYCEELIANANQASLKIFSEPEFYAKIFSDVLEEDEPAIIGGLKIEKEDDDTIVVTDIDSGDEAQITVDDDDEFIVSETQKELSDEEKTYSLTESELADLIRMFSEDDEEDDDEDEEEDDEDLEDEECDDEECEDEEDEAEEDDDEEEDEDEEGPEQYEPLYVVGIDPDNHVIVDAPVYDEEDAEELAQRLEEDGVEAIEIFDNQEDAREHAHDLMGEVGVEDVEEDVDEPEAHNFSDVTIYTTRYYSDHSNFMLRLFAEAGEGISDSQDDIEDAINSGEQIETETEVITPIDDETAIVHDKDSDEYTKAVLDGEEITVEKISEEDADELVQEAEEEEENEKKFSVLDRFFAEVANNMEASAPAALPAPGQEQQATVDPSQVNPETGDPVGEDPNAGGAPVELIEDKALAAVQSIQEAANEAVLAITEAKEAPAPGEEQDLKEAQFSYYDDYEEVASDPLATWLVNL